MVCCNTWFHLVPMQHLVDQTHCHLFYKKWQGLTENETFYKSGTNFLNEITFLCELIHTFPLSFLEAYLSLFPASGGPIRSVLPGSCRGLLILPNTVKDWLVLQGPPFKARLWTNWYMLSSLSAMCSSLRKLLILQHPSISMKPFWLHIKAQWELCICFLFQ